MNNIINEVTRRFKRLTPSQQVIALVVVAILVFLLRNILLLIAALIAIGFLIWVFVANQAMIITAFRSVFCLMGVC